LVDPPIAALVRMAFSKAPRVRIALGRTSSSTSETIRCPAAWAVS
jgi:hypothetical protein